MFTSHTANFQKFNRPFMRLLREMGYEIHYTSAGEEKILDADKSFAADFPRSPFRLDKLIKSYRQLKEVLDKNHYEIIHTHTPVGSIITRLAARNARKEGTRVIYTAHGFHFMKGGSKLGWLLWYPIEKTMARQTDVLITINKEDYERAKEKFKTDVRYVDGVGIDISRFSKKMTKKERNTYRKKLGLKPDDFVIIYIAELSRGKNHKMILSATADLVAEGNSNIKLLLPGKDSMNGHNQKLAKELGIEKNVQFLGYRKDIPALLKISDLYVSTSNREGLAINILEALASGLPVIGTRVRGHVDEIEFVELGDVKSLAKKILGVKNGRTKMAQSLPKKYYIENALRFHKELYEESEKQN